MIRRAALLLAMTAVVATACSKKQPPPAPTPQAPPPQQTTPQQPVDDSAARAAEAERLAAAERARLRTVIEEMVFFDYDQSNLRSDAEQALQRKIPILRSNPNAAIRITGHADERGSVEYNLALGLRRANAVRDYLANFGIDASRVETDTMGEDRPLDAGMTESAYARNRRAEFGLTRGGDSLVAPR
jgi:peptidoglycan-associated lipoprotein